MVVSVVVGLWNVSISRLDDIRIISRSRKLIHPLFLCVGLSFMFVCIWFMCVLTLRQLMSYIYGAPILDVSRSHTTMQHSR